MELRKSVRTEPHYYSERLKYKLDKLRSAPVAIVEAPSGYGKTTAVRDYLRTVLPEGTPVYWFTAADETPGAAYRRLCREIEKVDRNAGEQLIKIGLPNTVTIGEVIDILREIRCIHEAYLVIDNFQYLYNVLPTDFITALFEHSGEGLHIIFITHMIKKGLHAAIKSKGFLYVGAADLRLNAEEIRCYYFLEKIDISPGDARLIADYTGGWVIAVYLQLRAYRETGRLVDALGILELMDSLIWEPLTEEQKKFLLYLSPFKMITTQQACALIGYTTLPEYALNALDNPFIRYDAAEQRYELHDILSDLIVQKRKECGAVFESQCMLRAGDLCRDEGRATEALGFYARIKDYERILSLDLSQVTQETINGISIEEIALDIACNCPIQIKKGHILSMLQVAWTLRMSELTAHFDSLMKELHEMPELYEDSYLLGEWKLLSSYSCFPDIAGMTAILKQVVPLFGDRCSRVILPTVPWCFGNYSPFSEFHMIAGEADKEADDLEEYIGIYSRLTNGHGSGSDVLFRTELAYQRGNLKEAEILAYKAVYIAENKKQGIVQLGATMQLAEVALHKADTEGWQHAISSMERAVSSSLKHISIIRPMLEIIKGVLLGELQFYGDIAEWLRTGDFSDHLLFSNTFYNAMFVHLFYLMQNKEYERLIGESEAIEMEYVQARPFAEHLFCLLTAVGYLGTGNREKAVMLIEHAAERAIPDGLIFTFTSFTELLQGLTDEVVKRAYPALSERFDRVRNRFLSGWAVLHDVMSPEEIPSDLTEREYQVAKLAAAGLRNGEIAEKLSVTESTVRTHLRTIFQKLQIDRRAKLAERLK